MGTPFFLPGPMCGTQAPPWAQHAENPDVRQAERPPPYPNNTHTHTHSLPEHPGSRAAVSHCPDLQPLSPGWETLPEREKQAMKQITPNIFAKELILFATEWRSSKVLSRRENGVMKGNWEESPGFNEDPAWTFKLASLRQKIME